MLEALFLIAVAAPFPATPGCPPRAEILSALEVTGAAWGTACGHSENGTTLIAAVDRGTWSEGQRYAVVGVLDHGAVRVRSDLIFIARESKEITRAISDAVDWRVEIEPTRLGHGINGRIGIFVNHGDDYFVGEEVVVLLRIASNSIDSVWMGRGDHLDRRFDSCVLATVADFAMTKDGQLSRTRSTKRKFRNAGVDDSLAADLKKNCVALPKRTEFFPVPKADIGVRP